MLNTRVKAAQGNNTNLMDGNVGNNQPVGRISGKNVIELNSYHAKKSFQAGGDYDSAFKCMGCYFLFLGGLAATGASTFAVAVATFDVKMTLITAGVGLAGSILVTMIAAKEK